MNLKRLIILMIIFLFLIPTAFAGDNQTDYYFDASNDDIGNGTLDNPYREFSNDKITNNSIIHLNNGNYSLTDSFLFSNITFHGKNSKNTILNGNGFKMNVSEVINFRNITLTNIQLLNTANLSAVNTVFTDMISTNVKYNNSYGGAIYAPTNKNIFLDNCTFMNNTARYGGVIYAEGGNLTILNSQFYNNYAGGFGGAISCRNTKINISKTNFRNITSLNDAGGSIYLLYSTMHASNITITNSKANFGGAITSLSSIISMNDSLLINNTARYDGGAIYAMYGEANITTSKFINNTADNGGAVYINGVLSNISSNEFTNNTAFRIAGAIYNLLSNDTSKNNFTNNDNYNTSKVNITIGNGNYTVYVNNQVFNTTLPSYFNLNDYGWVTPVKDQQDGGNCWAFSTMAALESCILKASGEVLDLSENNMKNLMAVFSNYGINYRFPNNGGDSNMPIGYLVSWLGAVNESDDEYNNKNHISPVLDSIVHVQNVLFLKRSNYTDNDNIKLAILNYGAVSTTMYYDVAMRIGGKVYHYYNGTSATNHAVAIVGWDDDVEITNAPGKGAWIVKNSWGANWAQNGYFYVSYYDTAFARPNSTSTFTFILNDTLKYDKNYQYDFSGTTDYFYLPNNTVWYQNQYMASDDEFIASVSTYFLKDTDWVLEIFVNDKLQLTQNGSSKPGYYTINLNQPIPLIKGDIFKVSFKISVDGDVAFPISEIFSTTKYTYYPNCSFFSLNGEDFFDLYDYVYNDYPGHTYSSQVTCIKAFTQFMTLNSTIKSINITYDSLDLFNITARLFDENNNPVGNGWVIFTVNGVNYKCGVYQGVAYLKTNLKVGNNSIVASFTSPNYYTSNFTTSYSVDPVKLVLNITVFQDFNNARITFNLSQKVNESIIINNQSYNTTDGVYVLDLYHLAYGNYSIEAKINSSFYMASNMSSFFVNIKKTLIEVNNLTTIYNSGEFLKVTLRDEFNQSVVGRVVQLKIDGKVYSNITDSEGIALISISLTNSTYYGVVCFNSDDLYIESQNTIMIKVLSSITLPNISTYTYNSSYKVYVLDKHSKALNNTEITFKIGNDKYYALSDSEGIVCFSIPIQSGDVTIEVINPETNEILYQNISVKKRLTQNSDISIYYGAIDKYTVSVLDDYGNFTGGFPVKFTINGETYISYTDSDGYASVEIKNLKVGMHSISCEYKGFKVSNTITVKKTLITKNLKVKKSKPIKFTAKLLNNKGKVMKGKKITFKFKGKTYKVKTNKKGIATIKIKNKFKVGKYKIITSFKKIKITNIIRIKK